MKKAARIERPFLWSDGVMNGDLGHVGGGAEDEVDEEDDGDGDAADADGGGDPIDAFGWGVEMGVAVGAECGERGDIGAAVAAVGDGALFDVAGVAEDGKEGAQDEADEQGDEEERKDGEHGKAKADESAAAGFVAGHAPGLDGFGGLHEVMGWTVLTGLTGLPAAGGLGGGCGDEEADDDEHGDAEDLAKGLEGFPHDQAPRLRRGLGVRPRFSARSGVGAALEVSFGLTTCCVGSGTMLAVAVGGADVWKGVMESAVCAQVFFG